MKRPKMCAGCGHELSHHDPEDGTCDAHRDDGGIGVCPCGRDAKDLQIMRLKIIASHVPARVWIKAKEDAGLGDVVSVKGASNA